MAKKTKVRLPPEIEEDTLTANFAEQLDAGRACDALLEDAALPSLYNPRGQETRIDRSLLRSVTLPDRRVSNLRMQDCRIEDSDLANAEFANGIFERVEFVSTRLTGAGWSDARLKSVLFRECKLDLAAFRMAKLELCVFERCILVDGDFYGADLTGTIFRGCDLSRAELSQSRLTNADLRDCKLDAVRGTPFDMAGLTISPDQAPLLITLFGVRVQW